MGQVEGRAGSGYRPDYSRDVLEAMKYLASLEICPEARPYVLLMYNVAVLSGILAQLDAVVSTARGYGVNCELDVESQATDLLNRAIELIKGRKASLEEALSVTDQVMEVVKMLGLDMSICLVMAGLAGAGQEDATG